jgi:hypothetical protein
LGLCGAQGPYALHLGFSCVVCEQVEHALLGFLYITVALVYVLTDLFEEVGGGGVSCPLWRFLYICKALGLVGLSLLL